MLLPFPRALVACAVCAATPIIAAGGWDEPTAGRPLLSAYTTRAAARPLSACSVALDSRNCLVLVGTSDGVLAFNGSDWRALPTDHPLSYVRALHVGTDGRVWTGGVGEIGWFENVGRENCRFQSLLPLLPAGLSARLNDVWFCTEIDGAIWFSTNDMVIRWDGRTTRHWEFPGTRRLYSFQSLGETWFHHRETGLYRLTPQGPELAYPPAALPERGVLQLIRLEGDLVCVSSAGFHRVGAPHTPLGSPSAVQFLQSQRLSSVVPRPDGSLIASTVGGLGLISPRLDLVRTFDTGDGLPSASIEQLAVDEHGGLWIASAAGLACLSLDSSASRLGIQGHTERFEVEGLAHFDGALHATAAGHLLRLHSEERSPAALASLAKLPRRTMSLRAAHPALLIGDFAGVSAFDGWSVAQLTDSNSDAVFSLLPLRHQPGSIVVGESYKLSLLAPDSSGWRKTEIVRDIAPPMGLAEDHDGGVWVAGWDGTIYRIEMGTEAPARVLKIPPHPGTRNETTLVTGSGRAIYFASASAILQLAEDGTSLTRTATLPGSTARAMALSTAGDRLYLAFDRALGAGLAHGIGYFELTGDGRPEQWVDLQVPRLGEAGTVSKLVVIPENGRDTLWLGGTEGLLRLRPTEIPAWAAPAPPRLVVDGNPSGPAEFDFHGHKVAFEVRATDIALRPVLRIETKFGGPDAPWSAPGAQDRFQLSNLTEGTYTFAARLVNPAGQRSEPAVFTFRILPPWYRTPWAFGGYALLLSAVVAGAIFARERRIRARNAQLEHLVALRTAELVRANSAKDEFLASMSHEIRNPMNGVVGLSAAIDISPLDAEGRHRFGLLRHCATHLATLLDDILDFTRLQSGHIELNEQPFAPAELVESIIALTAAESAATGLPVNVALAPTIPPRVVGDARRIRQILLNFVSNALKYAGRGTIEVTGWSHPLPGGRVELTLLVSDDGPGIPLEEQARVFEKFERGASTRASHIPGTGMGLAVCRQLSERMGGRVWLESTPGQGAAFYLALPVAVAPADPVVPTETDRLLRHVPKRALVVDDEEYNRIALAGFLADAGFTVTEAGDAEIALATARAHRFDLICIDYQMPGITGPEVARRLRATPPHSGEPPLLFATTAYSTLEKRTECLEAGMDGFISKPVSRERLAEALQAALGRRTPATASGFASAEPILATAVDPLDNLRLVARRNQRSVEEETALLIHAGAAEFAALDEAFVQRNAIAAARAAHQLAGRFAFLRASVSASLALELEQDCRHHDWASAESRTRLLAAAWSELLARLPLKPAAPAASDRSQSHSG